MQHSGYQRPPQSSPSLDVAPQTPPAVHGGFFYAEAPDSIHLFQTANIEWRWFLNNYAANMEEKLNRLSETKPDNPKSQPMVPFRPRGHHKTAASEEESDGDECYSELRLCAPLSGAVHFVANGRGSSAGWEVELLSGRHHIDTQSIGLDIRCLTIRAQTHSEGTLVIGDIFTHTAFTQCRYNNALIRTDTLTVDEGPLLIAIEVQVDNGYAVVRVGENGTLSQVQMAITSNTSLLSYALSGSSFFNISRTAKLTSMDRQSPLSAHSWTLSSREASGEEHWTGSRLTFYLAIGLKAHAQIQLCRMACSSLSSHQVAKKCSVRWIERSGH